MEIMEEMGVLSVMVVEVEVLVPVEETQQPQTEEMVVREDSG